MAASAYDGGGLVSALRVGMGVVRHRSVSKGGDALCIKALDTAACSKCGLSARFAEETEVGGRTAGEETGNEPSNPKRGDFEETAGGAIGTRRPGRAGSSGGGHLDAPRQIFSSKYRTSEASTGMKVTLLVRRSNDPMVAGISAGFGERIDVTSPASCIYGSASDRLTISDSRCNSWVSSICKG